MPICSISSHRCRKPLPEHAKPRLITLRSLRDTLDEHMVRVGICIEEHADADGATPGVRD